MLQNGAAKLAVGHVAIAAMQQALCLSGRYRNPEGVEIE
jgi:hypothetical protein